jgi:phosphoglycerate dehydrogenase-like enzyme
MTPDVDQVFPLVDLPVMLAEADHVIVAAPWTRQTDGLLGPREFAAMKPGAYYVNISRGPLAKEESLLEALRSGKLAGAGLDVFAVEPLPAEHPFWTMENVVVSPHYSGETVNRSPQPGQLLLRNLRSFLEDRAFGHVVDVNLGY